MDMAKLRKDYDNAYEAQRAAREGVRKATEQLYLGLLSEKGIAVGDCVEIVDASAKSLKGEFRIVDTGSSGTVLRFFPFKKDATLSGNPKAYNFGLLPNVSWDFAGISSVKKCSPPEPVVEA